MSYSKIFSIVLIIITCNYCISRSKKEKIDKREMNHNNDSGHIELKKGSFLLTDPQEYEAKKQVIQIYNTVSKKKLETLKEKLIKKNNDYILLMLAAKNIQSQNKNLASFEKNGYIYLISHKKYLVFKNKSKKNNLYLSNPSSRAIREVSENMLTGNRLIKKINSINSDLPTWKTEFSRIELNKLKTTATNFNEIKKIKSENFLIFDGNKKIKTSKPNLFKAQQQRWENPDVELIEINGTRFAIDAQLSKDITRWNKIEAGSNDLNINFNERSTSEILQDIARNIDNKPSHISELELNRAVSSGASANVQTWEAEITADIQRMGIAVAGEEALAAVADGSKINFKFSSKFLISLIFVLQKICALKLRTHLKIQKYFLMLNLSLK